MVVAIVLLLYMTSILLPFDVRIQDCSTFFAQKEGHNFASPLLISQCEGTLFCDNCTALQVCPYMRIFPLPKSVHLGIEFYLFVSHGGMKRQRFHV